MARRLALLGGSLPWLALLAAMASAAWFLCDDAFISFRYVRNLVEGHGLVFNPGERVEGYSNFLWVLELAGLWRVFGLRPENAAPWLSVACTVGTLAATVWWAMRLPGLRRRALVTWMALGLLCSSATFAVWTSAGGLETRQFTLFIVVAVVCLTVHGQSRWGLMGASLSLAAAAYTRPEAPLIAACCFGWFVAQRIAASRRLRVDWRELAWLVAPFVRTGGGALPVPLRLLRGVAAEHLLRQARSTLVRVGIQLLVGGGDRDRALPADTACDPGFAEGLARA